MSYRYKSIKYNLQKWSVMKRLSDVLSAERGTPVSLADASVEAATRLLNEKDAAGTPGGQAQMKE